MNREDIQMMLHEAGGIEKYEACLLEAVRVWSELPDHALAGLLASIGRFTQNDDEGKSLINVLGLFAYIGFIRTAKLAAGEWDSVEGRGEKPKVALAEEVDKSWHILAAEWMENVAKIQDAEGLTGEPEIEWLRNLAVVLRKEPEYLAKKKAADMADDAVGGA